MLQPSYLLTARKGRASEGPATCAADSAARILDHPELRIEITPITPGMKFWAFASVTHNVTQHVTTVLPATKPRDDSQ